jgi:hypothetical protein
MRPENSRSDCGPVRSTRSSLNSGPSADPYSGIEEIYHFPLRQSATDTLNRQLRTGISDEKLAELAMALHDDDRLCIVQEEEHSDEPQIICSLGLAEIEDLAP